MTSLREFLEARVAIPLGFSTDDERLLVQSNLTGTLQLFERHASTGELRALTDEKEPVTGWYVPGSDRVVVQRDDGGNERTQLYLLAETGGLEPLVVEPEAMHDVGGLSRDGRLLSYRTNRRNGVDFDVVVRDLVEGTERCVFDRGGFAIAGGFSPDGTYVAVHHLTERSGDNDVFLVEVATGHAHHVAPHDDESYVSEPAWLADGSACYVATDVGRDIPAIARYELATRSWAYVLETGGEPTCLVDPTGAHLMVATNDEGWTRAELFDATTLERRAEVATPGRGVCTAWTFSSDGTSLAYQFSSSLVPGDVWSVDTATGALTRLTHSPCGVDTASLTSPALHRFDSHDGESVPVFVFAPSPEPKAPAPVVVWVHGGPEAQARPAWNPVIGYLTTRGYAVAVPNVRGSTGYGKRYQHLDDRRLRLDSVADLASLHDWLGAQPSIDESRAALFGGSYGGYMVLAGLTFQPERWAAGVDVVGISSLVTFLEHTSAYRRRLREREYGFLDTDREFLHEASPLTHLDRLRAPLFIIHGANDPRVPLSEAEQLHDTLARKGVDTELLVYPDEGHGLAKLVNRLDAYPRAVEFLDRVLGVQT